MVEGLVGKVAVRYGVQDAADFHVGVHGVGCGGVFYGALALVLFFWLDWKGEG